MESLAGPPGILPAQWNARSDPSSRHPIPVRSLVTLLPPELGWGAVSCQTFGLLDQVVVTPNLAPFPFSTRRERVDWGFGRLWVVVAGVDPLRFLKPPLCGARGGPRGEPVCPLPAGFIAAWNRSCLLLSSEAIRRASGTFPANRSDPPIGWLRRNIAPARSSTEESSSLSRRNAAFPAKSRACMCANWLTATDEDLNMLSMWVLISGSTSTAETIFHRVERNQSRWLITPRLDLSNPSQSRNREFRIRNSEGVVPLAMAWNEEADHNCWGSNTSPSGTSGS